MKNDDTLAVLKRIELLGYSADVGPYRRGTQGIAMSPEAGSSIFEVKVRDTGHAAEYRTACLLARMVGIDVPMRRR